MSNLNGELKGTSKHYIGKVNGERIYLSAPSWDCGWYWGFGYLGNRNCHYHLDGLGKENNKNLFVAIVEHFDDLQIKESKLWTFCELMNSAYKLRETAEILGEGGTNYTTNPLKELIKNESEAKRINEVVLPAIFLEIEKCFKGEVILTIKQLNIISIKCEIDGVLIEKDYALNDESEAIKLFKKEFNI